MIINEEYLTKYFTIDHIPPCMNSRYDLAAFLLLVCTWFPRSISVIDTITGAPVSVKLQAFHPLPTTFHVLGSPCMNSRYALAAFMLLVCTWFPWSISVIDTINGAPVSVSDRLLSLSNLSRGKPYDDSQG